MDPTVGRRVVLLVLALACLTSVSCDFLLGTPFSRYFEGAPADAEPPEAPDVTELPYTELSDPENWSQLQQYLDEQAALGVSGTPTATLDVIPVTGGGYKWVDGVLAPNGRIYVTDPQRARVLAFNPDGVFNGIIHTGMGGTGEGQLGRPGDRPGVQGGVAHRTYPAPRPRCRSRPTPGSSAWCAIPARS